MTAFTGFPLAGLDFYEDLEADNSKSFWTAHKSVYDEAVKAPMIALCAELEVDFGTAKIFRPYRDVRFAADKTPYKNHQGAVVATVAGAGWYVQIGAPGLFVAGGLYAPTSAQLARLRDTIAHEIRGPELEKILSEAIAAGFTLGGDKLKTKPKGYEAEHPRIELLRHKSIVLSRQFGAPDWLPTPKAAKEIRAAWEMLRPAVDWLSAVAD